MEKEKNTANDIFCREEIIGASTIKKVGTMRVVLSMDGVEEYHLLVMPIRHVENAASLSIQERDDMVGAVGLIERFYASHGIGGYKQILLSGPAAGRTVPHLHWHIIPGNSEFVTDPKQRKIHYSAEELKDKTKTLAREFGD